MNKTTAMDSWININNSISNHNTNFHSKITIGWVLIWYAILTFHNTNSCLKHVQNQNHLTGFNWHSIVCHYVLIMHCLVTTRFHFAGNRFLNVTNIKKHTHTHNTREPMLDHLNCSYMCICCLYYAPFLSNELFYVHALDLDKPGVIKK